jgi:hypothetical protein
MRSSHRNHPSALHMQVPSRSAPDARRSETGLLLSRAQMVLRKLALELMRKLDDELKHSTAAAAAFYEHRLQAGPGRASATRRACLKQMYAFACVHVWCVKASLAHSRLRCMVHGAVPSMSCR